MSKYTPPTFEETAFNCPHCDAFSEQRWFYMGISGTAGRNYRHRDELQFCVCHQCNKYSVWNDQKMIFPDATTAPLPHPDFPEEIKRDFEEARSIASRSPRGAAALLRLCIQNLCVELGESGHNINDDIAALVEKSLPVEIQQALDTVRVVGNNAVHPGQIDLRDDVATATSLFELTNIITDRMIGQPKRTKAMYNKLPQSAKDQIQERDKK